MAKHVTGIAITIKAFISTGKTLDTQFAAMSAIREAHATGDYSTVLKIAKIDEVKSEQKTRRMEIEEAATDAPQTARDEWLASADYQQTKAEEAILEAGDEVEERAASRRKSAAAA